MPFKCLLLITGLIMASCGAAFAQATVSSQVQVTPNAGAYSAGQCLGGILTIPNMIRPGNAGGAISAQLDIVDPTGHNAVIDVWYFNALPTGTYTDHSTCTIAAGDVSKIAGIMQGTSLACSLDGTSATGVCQSSPGVLQAPLSFPAQSSNLWAIAIMQGTPTYGSSKTLYFNFKAFPD